MKLTTTDRRVLFILLSGLKDEYSAIDIWKMGGFYFFGGIYVSLVKFERQVWVNSRWISEEQPSKRLYRLSAAGRVMVMAELSR